MGGFAWRFKVVPSAAKVALYLLPFFAEQLQALGKPRGNKVIKGGNDVLRRKCKSSCFAAEITNNHGFRSFKLAVTILDSFA